MEGLLEVNKVGNASLGSYSSNYCRILYH